MLDKTILQNKNLLNQFRSNNLINQESYFTSEDHDNNNLKPQFDNPNDEDEYNHNNKNFENNFVQNDLKNNTFNSDKNQKKYQNSNNSSEKETKSETKYFNKVVEETKKNDFLYCSYIDQFDKMWVKNNLSKHICDN